MAPRVGLDHPRVRPTIPIDYLPVPRSGSVTCGKVRTSRRGRASRLPPKRPPVLVSPVASPAAGTTGTGVLKPSKAPHAGSGAGYQFPVKAGQCAGCSGGWMTPWPARSRARFESECNQSRRAHAHEITTPARRCKPATRGLTATRPRTGPPKTATASPVPSTGRSMRLMGVGPSFRRGGNAESPARLEPRPRVEALNLKGTA